MDIRRFRKHASWLLAITAALAISYAVRGDDPTPEEIDQATTPTKETVGDNTPVLTARVEKTKIACGQPLKLYVEVRNEGRRDLVVYMPALEAYVDLKPDPKWVAGLTKTEGGVTTVTNPEPPPPWCGRGKNIKEAKDFVVLSHGDCYGRYCEYPAVIPGEAKVRAIYQNKNNGGKVGLAAWTGKATSKDSETVKIVDVKK